jgi:hypothetical protein
MTDYIRDLRPAKWDLGVSLHGSNPEPPMSAMGQKQTSPRSNGMSALPPKADIAEHNHHVRFVPIADINISLAVSAGWVILLAVGP